jgi:hypothetical protein
LEHAILLASGDSRRNIDALKLQASSSKTYYEKLFHDHETRLVPYQHDMSKLQSQLHELQTKKSHLLHEITILDEEMTHLTTKASTIQSFLTELQSQHEKQINTLNSSHGHVVEAIEKDNQIQNLFLNLNKLETVLDEVSTIGMGSITSLSQTLQETVKTDGLVDTFLQYSSVESKCIEFLTKRVILMKEKVKFSDQEVVEYKNLGMTVSFSLLPCLFLCLSLSFSVSLSLSLSLTLCHSLSLCLSLDSVVGLQGLATEIAQSTDRIKENIAEDLAALETLQISVCELLTALHSTVRSESLLIVPFLLIARQIMQPSEPCQANLFKKLLQIF